MKCPNCGGKGKYKNVFGKVDGCYYCLGTGEVNGKSEQVHTNEGWFCGLSTEEKAEWLNKHSEFMYNCGKNHVPPKIINKDEWQAWLKQPHTLTRSKLCD